MFQLYLIVPSMYVSHQVQMTLVLRYVDISTSPIKIDDHFVEFLKVDDTFGKGIFNEIISVIKSLDFFLRNNYNMLLTRNSNIFSPKPPSTLCMGRCQFNYKALC